MELIIPQHILFKLRVWRDMGSTEVTGFFISEKDNMNHIIDAKLVKAACTGATVYMAPEDLATFYQAQMKEQIYPDQLQVWWHTHPGSSAGPSGTDEATFRSLGKDRTFNMMYILARGGQEFAQLSVTDKKSQHMIKEPMEIEHPMEEWIDFEDHKSLQRQFDECVQTNRVATSPYFTDTVYPTQENQKKFTQREIFEQNSKKTSDIQISDDPQPDIYDELDAEYDNANSFPNFLIMAQEMVEENDISEIILNEWFKHKNIKTRLTNGVFR